MKSFEADGARSLSCRPSQGTSEPFLRGENHFRLRFRSLFYGIFRQWETKEGRCFLLWSNSDTWASCRCVQRVESCVSDCSRRCRVCRPSSFLPVLSNPPFFHHDSMFPQHFPSTRARSVFTLTPDENAALLLNAASILSSFPSWSWNLVEDSWETR